MTLQRWGLATVLVLFAVLDAGALMTHVSAQVCGNSTCPTATPTPYPSPSPSGGISLSFSGSGHMTIYTSPSPTPLPSPVATATGPCGGAAFSGLTLTVDFTGCGGGGSGSTPVPQPSPTTFPETGIASGTYNELTAQTFTAPTGTGAVGAVLLTGMVYSGFVLQDLSSANNGTIAVCVYASPAPTNVAGSTGLGICASGAPVGYTTVSEGDLDPASSVGLPISVPWQGQYANGTFVGVEVYVYGASECSTTTCSVRAGSVRHMWTPI